MALLGILFLFHFIVEECHWCNRHLKPYWNVYVTVGYMCALMWVSGPLTQTPVRKTTKISFLKKVSTWYRSEARETSSSPSVISTAWTGSDVTPQQVKWTQRPCTIIIERLRFRLQIFGPESALRTRHYSHLVSTELQQLPWGFVLCCSPLNRWTIRSSLMLHQQRRNWAAASNKLFVH